MDNNNLHDDSIEEDLNPLASNNGLSPLEDAISKGIDNEEDTSNFSSIKKSFEQNLQSKQPPMFTWAEIEQGLDALDDSDLPESFSVLKNGFEQTYKEHETPSFDWGGLDDNLDEADSQEGFQSVKDGFEQKNKGLILPLFPWQDLDEEMRQDASEADSPQNYSTVKKSFEQKYQEQHPQAVVWAKIQESLNKETITGRLQISFKNILSRIYQQRNVLLMLLLCMVFCEELGDDFVQTNAGSGKEKASVLAENVKNKNKRDVLVTKTNLTVETIKTKTELVEVLEKNTINPIISTTKKTSKITELPLVTNVVQPKELNNEPVFLSDDNVVITENTSNQIVDEKLIVVADNKEINHEKEVVPFEKEPQKNIEENTLNNSKGDLITTNPLLSNSIEQELTIVENNTKNNNSEKSFNNIAIELLFLNPINLTTIQAKKEAELEQDLVALAQNTNHKKIRFEVGLIGRFGTSVFLGNTNSESVRSSSFSKTKNHLAGSVGVTAQGYLTANDAIVLAAYPYSTVSQYFGEFTGEGYYTNKEIKLSYFDFTLGYQRIFARYKGLGNFPSQVYARLDLGFGYLNEEKTTVDGILVENTGNFNKINLSLGMALGHSHQLNQLIIDYGITSNLGVNNLVTETNKTAIQATNLLNIGAYISARYIMFSPIKMNSKKTLKEESLIYLKG